ncbi:MAG TPA: hypothetical protein VKW78_14700 [Terriglobales bacterium]|nr:hypothetical protein [Terriglobales bacterium]
MWQRITIFLGLLTLSAAFPVRGATAFVPISRARIAEALQAKFGAIGSIPITITPAELEIPTAVVARIREPRLLVDSLLQRPGTDQLAARMHCVPSADCIPFLVLLRLPQTERILVQQAVEQGQKRRPGAIVVPAGTHPTLLLDHGDIHISMRVRSLQFGRVGERVRVSADAIQKIYAARVIAEDLVRVEDGK